MSGANKPYLRWEKKYIITLKKEGHSWENLTMLYNYAVCPDRQRTEKTLRSQYKHIQQNEPALFLSDDEANNESDAEGDVVVDEVSVLCRYKFESLSSC